MQTRSFCVSVLVPLAVLIATILIIGCQQPGSEPEPAMVKAATRKPELAPAVESTPAVEPEHLRTGRPGRGNRALTLDSVRPLEAHQTTLCGPQRIMVTCG